MSSYINKNSELWFHTKMRIDNALNRSQSEEEFTKKMVQRLMKIKNKNKLDYAIEYLKDKGYTNVAEMYESKIMMDELTGI